MSKSLGNGIDPLEIIDKYGADALRFFMAAMETQGRDINMSEARIAGYRNFATKLWNAARFGEMNECRLRSDFDETKAELAVNRWIIAKAKQATKEVTDNLNAFRFSEAANAVYQFTWGSFCDWYIEMIKPILYGEDEKAKAETNLYLDKPAANIYWADNTHWLYFGEEREDRPCEKAIVFQGNQLCDDRLVFDHVPEFTVTVPRLPQHSRLEYSFTLLATAKIAELKNFNDVTIDQVKVNVTLMETDAVDNSKLQELVVYKLDIRLHPENRKNVPEGTPMENGWILAETEGGPMYYFAIISSKDPSELVRPIGGISELDLLETYSTPELIEQYGDAFNAAAHQKGTENNLYFG